MPLRRSSAAAARAAPKASAASVRRLLAVSPLTLLIWSKALPMLLIWTGWAMAKVF